MANATIGDDFATMYEFEFDDGMTRTSDEIGDLSEFECSMEDIVDLAQEDDECTVHIIGFE